MSEFLSYICMNTLRGELSSAMRRGLKKEILWLLECTGMDRHENTYSWYFMFFACILCTLFLKSVIMTSDLHISLNLNYE